MIINCNGQCGRRVIVPNVPDGKSYLCKPCWKSLIQTLLHIIRPAKEPHLEVVKTIETESVA